MIDHLENFLKFTKLAIFKNYFDNFLICKILEMRDFSNLKN